MKGIVFWDVMLWSPIEAADVMEGCTASDCLAYSFILKMEALQSFEMSHPRR
jgi:hypothetical protein